MYNAELAIKMNNIYPINFLILYLQENLHAIENALMHLDILFVHYIVASLNIECAVFSSQYINHHTLRLKCAVGW